MRSTIRASPYAITISKYCKIFLAVAVLIGVVIFVWYLICNDSFCTTSTSTMPQKAKPLVKNGTNILAFGDSMTKGYVTGRNGIYYPYSASLEKTLNRLYNHSGDVVFIVDNHGKNGDRAIGTAQARLKAALQVKQYEWVIIVLGTNDLSAYFKYKSVRNLYANKTVFLNKLFDSIKTMCEMALQTHNSIVILGTVTAWRCEEQVPICSSLSANRNTLNTMIRDFVNDTKELLILADFDKELDYKSMSKVERKKYWYDHVHLTPTGYKAMAKLIYKKMLPYIEKLHKLIKMTMSTSISVRVTSVSAEQTNISSVHSDIE